MKSFGKYKNEFKNNIRIYVTFWKYEFVLSTYCDSVVKKKPFKKKIFVQEKKELSKIYVK